MKIDLLQSIILKCEKEIASGQAQVSSGTLADEILAMIDASEEIKKPLPIASGLGSLELTRPLVVCDLEATGTEIGEARIIEFAGIKIFPDGQRESLSMLIHPGFLVSAEIEELTGISNLMLVSARPFSEHAQKIWEFLDDSYFMGYGGRNFDAPLLWEEFNRLKLNLDIRQDSILDPLEIFQAQEPRTLTGAARFYLQENHEGAHRAMPDVEMTIKVLEAQIAKYPDLPLTIYDLIQTTRRDRRVDMAGKIALNDDGVACYTFGDSTKGKPVRSNTHFAQWMLGKAFPEQTKRVIRHILNNA